MEIWTLLIMLLLVFQLPVKFAGAQANVILDARNIDHGLHVAFSPTAGKISDAIAFKPTLSARPFVVSKMGYLPLNHYKGNEWSTFSIHYNSTNPTDEWLNENNLVMVKSFIQIANRLMVGINCRYNWSFAIGGNGAGMVLNKLPIKIYFAAVMGGAPDLCHR